MQSRQMIRHLRRNRHKSQEGNVPASASSADVMLARTDAKRMPQRQQRKRAPLNLTVDIHKQAARSPATEQVKRLRERYL
jgi:hypothetical protein